MQNSWWRESRDYQIDLVGPTRRNHQWQAKELKGFDADHFLIDWDQQQAICPEGHESLSWTPAIDSRTNEVIRDLRSRRKSAKHARLARSVPNQFAIHVAR